MTAVNLLYFLLCITFVMTLFCLVLYLISPKKKEGFRSYAERQRDRQIERDREAREFFERGAREAKEAAERVAREAREAAERVRQEAERIARAAREALDRALNGISGPINSLKDDFERIPNEFNNLGSQISNVGSTVNSAVGREMGKVNDNIKSLGGPINTELNNINDAFKSIPGVFDKLHVDFTRVPQVTINR